MTKKKQSKAEAQQAKQELVGAQQEHIKLCCRGLYDTQKLRIQLQLRIDRLVREKIMTKAEAKTFFAIPFKRMEEAEDVMAKLLWPLIKNVPIVKQYLKHVKGIGPRLSGLLLANIAPIERFETTSKLWAYAGLKVEDGRAVKRAKGQKANWNSELKTTCWKIAKSFTKCKGGYRKLYDEYKARIIEREVNKGNIIWGTNMQTNKKNALHFAEGTVIPEKPPENPEWTAGRIDNMALRYIVKRFLSHLWLVWRQLEGLPVREAYVVEYLGHTHQDDPWDYVEIVVPARKAS